MKNTRWVEIQRVENYDLRGPYLELHSLSRSRARTEPLLPGGETIFLFAHQGKRGGTVGKAASRLLSLSAFFLIAFSYTSINIACAALEKRQLETRIRVSYLKSFSPYIIGALCMHNY